MRSVLDIVVSIGVRPSRRASATKSFAACSAGFTSSAFARAALSAASAASRSRICGPTSLSGFFPPGRTSSTLMA